MTGSGLTRAAAEDFLFEEARLLDEWRLDEWLALFTADARYEIPPLDVPDGDPRATLFLIADDMARLRHRVAQLAAGAVLAESPRSRTRRLLSGVHVTPCAAAVEAAYEVGASFMVHRFADDRHEVFVGRYRHRLVSAGGRLLIAHRRAILDNQRLSSSGKITILL